MKAALITVTLVELGLLVVVLAAYLIAIAGTLRRTPATSTFAMRFSASTSSTTWPGIARHISGER